MVVVRFYESERRERWVRRVGESFKRRERDGEGEGGRRKEKVELGNHVSSIEWVLHVMTRRGPSMKVGPKDERFCHVSHSDSHLHGLLAEC